VKKSELQEPLASFQATIFDKEEFKKLVNDLAQACGDSLREGQFDRLMDALWPEIDKSINTFKAELAKARKKSGEPEDTKPTIDPLLEEVVVRLREQGRLLGMLADQVGGGSGKELFAAVQEIKMMQRRMIHRPETYEEHRLFMDLDEEEAVRASRRFDSSRTSRMKMRELGRLLQSLPASFIANAKGNPETMFELLRESNLLDDSMRRRLRV
jgi:hypothetical protein